jgi:DNA-directed RNA polymerase subunit RPC12/RpoP
MDYVSCRTCGKDLYVEVYGSYIRCNECAKFKPQR